MKLLVFLGVMLVILSSGCAVQDSPGDNGSQVTNESVVSQELPSGPGWFCGSLKVNGSLITGRTGMAVDALEQAGLSFMGMLIDPVHPEQLDTCNQITSSGKLCIPSQTAGNNEGDIVAVGIHGELAMGQELEEMIEQAHSLGSVVYITHPMSSGNRTPWKRWDITSWDGLAVVSPMTQKRDDAQRAIDKWHNFLEKGHRVSAIGETDTKPFNTAYGLRNTMDSSYQCVWLEGELTEESVKKALVSGRSYVTNGPRLDFTIDGSGMGSTVNVSYGDEAELRLWITSDSTFNTVKIIRDGDVIQEIGKSGIRYNTTLKSTVLGESWFSVEVWGGDTTPEYHDFIHAISNPIWVNASLA